MEDKKKTIITAIAVIAIFGAVGVLAMQMMSGGGTQVKEPEQYSVQPPSDSSRYRGGGGSPTVDSDRM